MAGKRLRFRSHSQAEPKNINLHASGSGPTEKMTRCTAPAVTGAVVPTFTVAVCLPVPLICTEEGTLQVGAGVAAGLIAQVRFTVPLNVPVGVKAKLKFAVCPALMV